MMELQQPQGMTCYSCKTLMERVVSSAILSTEWNCSIWMEYHGSGISWIKWNCNKTTRLYGLVTATYSCNGMFLGRISLSESVVTLMLE